MLSVRMKATILMLDRLPPRYYCPSPRVFFLSLLSRDSRAIHLCLSIGIHSDSSAGNDREGQGSNAQRKSRMRAEHICQSVVHLIRWSRLFTSESWRPSPSQLPFPMSIGSGAVAWAINPPCCEQATLNLS